MPGSTGDHPSVNQSVGVLLVRLVCQSVYKRASPGVALEGPALRVFGQSAQDR